MLILAARMGQLSFSSLMEVYRERNLIRASFREGPELLAREQEFYSYLQRVFFATPGARYAVWQEDGHYTSACRLEPYRDGLILAGLETAPDHRRRGYALRLVQAVQDTLPDGTRLYSHVDKHNAASLGVHEKAGFCRIAESAVYLDGSADSRCCTFLWA